MAAASGSLCIWKFSSRLISGSRPIRYGSSCQLSSCSVVGKNTRTSLFPAQKAKNVAPCIVQVSLPLSSNYSGVKPPKRPLSSYFLFKQEHYPLISRANPNQSVTVISKELGQRWRNLPIGERERYILAAQEESRKYKLMLDKLSADEKEDISKQFADRRKKTKSFRMKKKLKELNRPKRPPTQYNLFTRERHMDRGTIPPREFMRQIAAEWRSMSTEQREPYKLEAKSLSKQYMSDMADWESRMKAEGHPEVVRGRKTPRKTAKRVTKKKKSVVKKTAKKTPLKKSSSKRSKQTDMGEDSSWMREE